jgi:putative protein-disulfide isomerase
MNSTLIYGHDPMCSWCWGFSGVYRDLLEKLPAGLKVERLLGGLAVDSDDDMPESMQMMLQQTWQRIEQMIPGVQFNFDFWSQCKPRRSTYPACRAVIAAREQGDQYDLIMTQQVQKAYYQQARNPSDNQTLIELAKEIDLDADRFSSQLVDPRTQEQLLEEINRARSMGIDSFPGLVLEHNGHYHRILTNYTEVDPILRQIESYLET